MKHVLQQSQPSDVISHSQDFKRVHLDTIDPHIASLQASETFNELSKVAKNKPSKTYCEINGFLCDKKDCIASLGGKTFLRFVLI